MPSKLRLAHANCGSESSVAIAMRIRCTTSRSDSLLLVNYHSTYSEETLLTKNSEYIYLQIPLPRQQDNNIFVLLARMSMYRDQIFEVLSD